MPSGGSKKNFYFNDSELEKLMGRPTLYNDEVINKILIGLMQGRSLNSICKGPDMPCKATVFNWLLDPDKQDFLDKYNAARGIQQDGLVDEMVDIADDGTNDWVERETKNGFITVLDHEHVQRSKLRVETRKYVAALYAPRKYGKALIDEDLKQNISIQINGVDLGGIG